MVVTGFCWAMTQWAPFALVSQGGVFLGLGAYPIPQRHLVRVFFGLARRGDIVSPCLGRCEHSSRGHAFDTWTDEW